MTLSSRFNSDLISIWTRDANNEKTIAGIRSVMMAKLSPDLTPKDMSNCYYKKHSEHKDYDKVVAKARLAQASKEDEGKIPEAEVKEEESEEALRKEAEEDKDNDNIDGVKV